MERPKFNPESEVEQNTDRRKELLEQLDRMHVYVPKEVAESGLGERTYFDAFVDVDERMIEINKKISDPGEVNKNELLKERDGLFMKSVELSRRMRTGIFDDFTYKRLQKAQKDWDELLDKTIEEKEEREEGELLDEMIKGKRG